MRLVKRKHGLKSSSCWCSNIALAGTGLLLKPQGSQTIQAQTPHRRHARQRTWMNFWMASAWLTAAASVTKSILFCRMMMSFRRMISTAAKCSDVCGAFRYGEMQSER